MPPERLTVNRPAVIFDVQGAEAVIIDLATGHYFRLDAPSTVVWSKFEAGIGPAELLATCDNPSALESRLPGIIDDLISRGLLRAAAEGEVSGKTGPTEPWHFEHFSLEEFTDLEDILGLDPIHEVDPVRGWPHQAGT